MKTQNQRLLEYLKTHKKGITQLEAYNTLGICRLSERVREINGLRTKSKFNGWRTVTVYLGDVVGKRERVKTRYGYAWVVRYRLV